jgi:hypothetical protein
MILFVPDLVRIVPNTHSPTVARPTQRRSPPNAPAAHARPKRRAPPLRRTAVQDRRWAQNCYTESRAPGKLGARTRSGLRPRAHAHRGEQKITKSSPGSRRPTGRDDPSGATQASASGDRRRTATRHVTDQNGSPPRHIVGGLHRYIHVRTVRGTATVTATTPHAGAQ